MNIVCKRNLQWKAKFLHQSIVQSLRLVLLPPREKIDYGPNKIHKNIATMIILSHHVLSQKIRSFPTYVVILLLLLLYILHNIYNISISYIPSTHDLCTSDVSFRVAFLMFFPNDCKELFVKALPCCVANACVFSAKVRAGASIWQEEEGDPIYIFFLEKVVGQGFWMFWQICSSFKWNGVDVWLRSNQETPSAIFSMACRRMGPASSGLPGMLSGTNIPND